MLHRWISLVICISCLRGSTIMLLTVPWFLVPLAVFGSLKCCSLHFVLHFVAFQEERKEESKSYSRQTWNDFKAGRDDLTLFEFIVHPLSWTSQSMNARQFLAAVWILRRESVCTTTLPRSRRCQNENELDKWREFQDVSSAQRGSTVGESRSECSLSCVGICWVQFGLVDTFIHAGIRNLSCRNQRKKAIYIYYNIIYI
jgi:hypothetical protein